MGGDFKFHFKEEMFSPRRRMASLAESPFRLQKRAPVFGGTRKQGNVAPEG
jgi:hypothetical protein